MPGSGGCVSQPRADPLTQVILRVVVDVGPRDRLPGDGIVAYGRPVRPVRRGPAPGLGVRGSPPPSRRHPARRRASSGRRVQPWLISPMTSSIPTATSSRNSSQKPDAPSIWTMRLHGQAGCVGGHREPGQAPVLRRIPIGTGQAHRPVRVISTVLQILDPVRTHRSPSRRAAVRIPARSDPASGSE